MTLLLDTGILYAYYDRSDHWHDGARRLIEAEAHGLVVPALVLPEVDYLLARRLGAAARHALYGGVAGGHFLVVDLPLPRYSRILELNERYSELNLGLVDAAVIATAEELGCGRIATTDRRHFTAITAKLPLELLPDPPL